MVLFFVTFKNACSDFIVAMSPNILLKTETCKFLEFSVPCCYFISWKDICSGLLGRFFFFVMSHCSLLILMEEDFFFVHCLLVMASFTKQTFQAQTKGHRES